MTNSKSNIVDSSSVKTNCIHLQKGETVPRDGVLYTPERHEDIENLLADIQAMSKKVDSSTTNNSFSAGKNTNFEKRALTSSNGEVSQHG